MNVRIAGIAAMIVCALSGASAATAYAEAEWLADGLSVPLGKKFKVEMKGKLTLRDLKSGIGIECGIVALGEVWEKSDKVEELKTEMCKTVEGSCGTPSLGPIHLPWSTELKEVSSEVRDAILSSGAGLPGFKASCFGIVQDECDTENNEPLLEDMPGESPEDVLAIFKQGAIESCTFGGANAGELSGELLITGSEGLRLSVTGTKEGEWSVEGAIVGESAKSHVEISGKFTIKDTKAPLAVECGGTGLAFVWEKFGEIEEEKSESCKTIEGTCATPAIVAVDLPWLMELRLAGTEVKARIVNDGKGEPGWEITCSGVSKDTCKTEAEEPLLENMPSETPPDVLEKFSQGAIATCTVGGASSGQLSGELLLAALEGLSLSVG